MDMDTAFATLELSSAPHSFFDALDEDAQMHIVNLALQNTGRITRIPLAMRLVKKLFYYRLTTPHAFLALCRTHLRPLREVIDRPSKLVYRLTSVIIDVRRTSKACGVELQPMPGILYVRMIQSVYKTLVKTKEERTASYESVEELWRQMHLALRVGARQQLLDAYFDHPVDYDWCVERLCRVLRHMDLKAMRGTRTLHAHHFMLVTVRDRLTQDTPALPGKLS
jgi:hypothetical protein